MKLRLPHPGAPMWVRLVGAAVTALLAPVVVVSAVAEVAAGQVYVVCGALASRLDRWAYQKKRGGAGNG